MTFIVAFVWVMALGLRGLATLRSSDAAAPPPQTTAAERQARAYREPYEAQVKAMVEAQMRAANAAVRQAQIMAEYAQRQAQYQAYVQQRIFEERMRQRTGQPVPPVPLPAWVGALGFNARPASLAALKKRFHEIALRTHPDKGGDARAFARAKAAYDLGKAEMSKRATP